MNCIKSILKKKKKNIEEVEIYPNDWYYMIKRNKDKNDEYYWWNKRTDEISYQKPESFESNETDSETDNEDEIFNQKIIKDCGEWKFMKTTYSENETKEWWWNPTTNKCQFEIPKSIKEIII